MAYANMPGRRRRPGGCRSNAIFAAIKPVEFEALRAGPTFCLTMTQRSLRRINRHVLTMPATHPARQFLEAFIRCQVHCVAAEQKASFQDQEWISSLDGARWTFATFAYTCLAFDIELDGWALPSPVLTDSEVAHLQGLPRLRTMMNECRQAALAESNTHIGPYIDQVVELLDLWDKHVAARLEFIAQCNRE